MEKDNKNIDHSLLMAYILGEADGKQIAEVGNWLSISEDNATYLKSLEMLWIESGKLKPSPVHVDTKKAWKDVSSKLQFNSNVEIEPKGKGNLQIKYIWRAAAVLILILGIYGLFKIISGTDQMQTLSSQDQIIQDTLHDGSIISLNTNSTLSYPEEFDQISRKVNLEGEAFFKVEHNDSNPFIIELNGARIKVLGTSFNVKEIPEEHMVEVYVESGSVELTAIDDERDTSSIVLESGEKGYINTKTGEVGKRSNLGMNANVITWLSNKFVFDDVKLDEVAIFLEGYFVISIKFGNDTIKEELINATFKNDDIDDILSVIAGTFGLQLVKENQTYTLTEYED